MRGSRSTERRGRAGGFSLLEILVAMSILALALAALYQAASGATRNVRADEKYAYGVELARSLLADHAVVPLSGARVAGETDSGFRWRVSSRPIDLSRSALSLGTLQTIEVSVSWEDGSRRREVLLDSVVEGRAL
jgi:general secretion pathway protein I